MTPYDERTGWIELPKLLSSDEVEGVLRECDRLLTLPPEERARGDKPAAGTRHLMELDTRSPAIEAVATRLETLGPIVAILGDGYRRDQVSYRSPQPGFGAQRLHADDVPSAPDEPARVATAIIALRDFTAANGATRIVPGSHLRPDLQRASGQLEHHDDERMILLAAGDALVFSGHLLHSGTRNQSAAERPALQIVWRV